MPIKRKLFIIFAIIVIIPLLYFVLLTFTKMKNYLIQDNLVKIEMTADFKSKIITNVFNSLLTTLRSAQGYNNIQRNLPVLTSGAEPGSDGYLQAKNMLDKQLGVLIRTDSFVHNILLLAPGGRIVYSEKAGHEKQSALQLALELKEKKHTDPRDKIIIGDIFMNPAVNEDTKYMLHMIAPATGLDGSVAGWIVFVINMDYIYEIIQNTDNLGKTGETLLVRADGQNVLFLNPLRHDSDAAFKRKTPFGSKSAVPAQKALLQDDTGGSSGILNDYRGVSTLASWRYIKVLNIGLVSKIDRDEALTDLRELEIVVIAIFILVVFIALFMASITADRISAPITRLEKSARIIGSGNLEHRASLRTNDELGRLSDAFDSMTDNLKKTMASRDELDEVNKQLEAFNYSAAHDLRSPLQIVTGYLQLLQKRLGAELDEDNRNYLTRAVYNLQRMATLITDLLNFSKTGKTPLQKSMVDMQALAEQMAEELLMSYGKKPELTIHPLKPVMADESMMRQVFQNLLSNALKYSSKKPLQKVEAGCYARENEIVYFVRDNGAGFPDEYKDKLFGIFSRLHARTDFEGNGVGLALVKNIVTRHGGRVWAEGKVDEGAVFYFSLPEKVV